MLQQFVRRNINIIFLIVLCTVLMVHGTSTSAILADTANYQIDIGDVFAEPSQIIEIPIQVKNLNPLSAFLIRFTYDSTIMRPYQLDYQSERKELDNYRKAMNLDLRNVVYDSTTFSGHGLNTISIDTSGRYCYPFYDDNTTFNAYAFHHPNDDSMHVETVFILFYPPMPPWDECHLNYWSEPLVTPQEDTVKTFANVLFQVESDVLPGTIGNITVCNYIQASPTDPISDLRDNQFTDTDATGYIFPDEGLGSGQIHIQEYVSYCGNIDGTAGIDILDIVCLINFIYKQGTAPIPLSSANVDGIPSIDILDIVHLVNFVYKNGPNPNCQ